MVQEAPAVSCAAVLPNHGGRREDAGEDGGEGNMTCLELPRLTGSLRAFSGLSSPYPLSSETNRNDYLEKKRKARARKEKEAGVSWAKLKGFIEENCNQDRHVQQEVVVI